MTLPRTGVDSIRFNMALGGKILGLGVAIPLDLHVPGFDLSVTGGFALRADWKFDFGFGLSASSGFYLATHADKADPELAVRFRAVLDGDPTTDAIEPFSANGKLLFFNASVTDQSRAGSGLAGQLSLNLNSVTGPTASRWTRCCRISATRSRSILASWPSSIWA
jgi:hypothetical protein